jgi:hypothetical protein
MDDQRSTKHVLEGQELIDYLVERAANDAKAAIIERDDQRKQRVGRIMSLVALVGVGSIISALKIFVRSEMDVIQAQVKEASAAFEKRIDEQAVKLRLELDAQVQSIVTAEVEKRIGDVRKTLSDKDKFEKYIELSMELPEKLAIIADRKDKYVTGMVEEMVAAARQMAELTHLTRRTRFLRATREVIDKLTAYQRNAEVDQFDDLLGDVMLTDQELCRKLIDHYGQRLVGSPESIDSQPDQLRRLQRYIGAIEEMNYPEKALLWRLFVEFKRNGYRRNDTIDRLLESSKDLSEVDNAEFWFELAVYTNQLFWRVKPTQEGRELERLMAELQRQAPETSAMMEFNIDSHPYLAQRLTSLRGNHPAWRDMMRSEEPERTEEDGQAPAAAPPMPPEETETAQAPAEAASAAITPTQPAEPSAPPPAEPAAETAARPRSENTLRQ